MKRALVLAAGLAVLASSGAVAQDGPVHMPPATPAPAAPPDTMAPATNAPAALTPATAPSSSNAASEMAPMVPDLAPKAAPVAVPTPEAAPAITNAINQVAPQMTPIVTPTPPNPLAEEDIADVRPPFLHSDLVFWIAVAVATLAVLGLLLWLWLRPKTPMSAKSAYELTLEKLAKARTLLSESQPMPYAVYVSEVIRGYLGLRFEAPSTRRTTEEFLRQMENDIATPLAEHRDLLREFLQSCDLVKFARYQPTLSELELVQDRAQNFVAATKPVPVATGRNGRRQ